jgi:hypothetical protein
VKLHKHLHKAEARVLVRVLYEASLNHLVQLLLSALALPDQVAVGTAAGNECLSVSNLILLLLVHLQLVSVLLCASRHVGVVVAAPVPQLPLLHDHHVSAHSVQEVLAVAHYNQNLQCNSSSDTQCKAVAIVSVTVSKCSCCYKFAAVYSVAIELYASVCRRCAA